MIALTLVPDTALGLLGNPETVRTNVFDKMLKTEHTTISLGDRESAAIQITASIDPASEMAQKWVPLLKGLSEMNGIHLRIFLNPTRIITELPIKRFYRHVLHAAPKFDESGYAQSTINCTSVY
jgi:UDP-glucose:glycoprotein glucosyltransferase